MMGSRFLGLGSHFCRRLLTQPTYTISAAAHNETVKTFLRSNPLQNNLALQNLRELMLSKHEVVDPELIGKLAVSDIISLLLRGVIDAKRTRGTIIQ